MKLVQHSFRLICVGTSLIYSVPTQAGWLCDGLGIGCNPVTATGRSTDGDTLAPTMINQNHPPEVFSFTVSGSFTKWSDVAAPNGDYIMDEMSISSLSQTPFIIEYFASDYMGNIDFKKKHGDLAIAFKEVLK